MRKGLVLVMMSIVAVVGAELVPLWETVPGQVTTLPEEERNQHIYNVSNPTLEFLPATLNEGVTAPAVLVIPGGAYQCEAYEKEGVTVGRWLNALGFHAAVVKYRIPNDRAGALMDVQRAVALVRERATEWKVDVNKIGMIGFSAGAHLTARVLAHNDHGLAFSLLIYPAYLSKDGIELQPDVVPAMPTVPTFVTQCNNDRAYVFSSIAYAGWLCRKNRAVEFHLYPTGGHGYGTKQAWIHEAKTWLEKLK